jgi:hypothetical protein
MDASLLRKARTGHAGMGIVGPDLQRLPLAGRR